MGIAALISPLLLPCLRKVQRGSNRNHRTISGAFREDLSDVLGQLKVYRRDEERLLAALGGLGAVSDCVHERKWSDKLTARHWFRDSMEILYVLLGPGEGRLEMLEKARLIPISHYVDGPPKRRRRRRKSGRIGQQQGDGGAPEAGSGPDGVFSGRGPRRRARSELRRHVARLRQKRKAARQVHRSSPKRVLPGHQVRLQRTAR